MCDTLGTLRTERPLFGKNSDRSPNEPQVLEFIPAMKPSGSELKATYITVPQAKETHAVLLSRPTWMWGAEIGVNDCGVCIGNEAVFTLGKYGKTGLTGMDLLRMALERSATAEAAVGMIIELLEAYGQGGNCGYDHSFYYDNSFLIMDRSSLFVLETCGRKWAYRQCDKNSISNRLCLGSDCDAYSSGEPYKFYTRHSEQIYTLGSGSASRRKQTQSCIDSVKDVGDIMSALRTHERGINPFCKGSVRSTCMHFGGIVGDHTTQSMAVELRDKKTVVWATGSSTPCVSLYKPWQFGTKPCAPFFTADSKAAKQYWYEQESFRRELIGKVIPKEYFAERDEIEKSWIKLSGSAEIPELAVKCAAEEKAFFDKWRSYSFETAKSSAGFNKRWDKKNGIFIGEAEAFL